MCVPHTVIYQTGALESRDHEKFGVSAHERPSSPISNLSGDISISQLQTLSRPEISLSFSPNHDLVQSYLYLSITFTISSRDIFIF